MLWESYFCTKTLIISGEECCKEDKDCDNHEQCSGDYCISACDIVSCRQNENCLAKDHRGNCTCKKGYILDPANSECYRGKRIQCNFRLCTSNLHRMKLLHSFFYQPKFSNLLFFDCSVRGLIRSNSCQKKIDFVGLKQA